MCGIAGFLDLSAANGVPENMLKTMERRGPDEKNIYVSDQCTLLHTRLTIIDPAGGRQPMALHLGREEYVLVYNGELYNTEELRRELIQCAHTFCGHSDTEVLLHAYAQWGADCVKKLNGIFAFAVWEPKRNRLFMARDRIGVKPLFYKLHRGGLIFASEMKTILAFPTVQAQLDRDGVSQLILLGPGRKPGSGVFRGIQEIEPGCCGYYEQGKLSTSRYWKLRSGEHRDSFPETVEKVRFLVMDSIKRQMVSDVPIGTFLSGGLDSSIISAVCAEEMGKKGQKLDTFSVDYRNNDKYFRSSKFQPNSDAMYIRLMEETLGCVHHHTLLTPEDLTQCIEDATLARDLPGMADVDFSLLAFCREIRQNVKVALSGECADEIFGGYPWYRDPEVRDAEGFPWAQNTMQRSDLLLPGIAEDPKEYVMELYRRSCRESDTSAAASEQDKRVQEMVNLNFRWFMQTLLDRKDRMSMYCGLEVRVPFCDYRIAEYLYNVPWEYKDYRVMEKGLLRRAMEGYLPETILYRKKSPYPKTFDPGYETIVESQLNAILQQKEAPIFSIVDRQRLREYLTRDAKWPWYGQLMGRAQTIAYFLQMNFWLTHYQVELLF